MCQVFEKVIRDTGMTGVVEEAGLTRQTGGVVWEEEKRILELGVDIPLTTEGRKWMWM